MFHRTRAFAGRRCRSLGLSAGNVLCVAALLAASAGAASAQNIAYEFTGADNFGTVNLTTGVYTQIGNSGLLLSGLGEVGGVVYGGISGGSTLYSVDVANGALTAIGDGAIVYGDTGSTLTSLYAIDSVGIGSDPNLWSIDPSTGAATEVGSLGVTNTGATVGLSTNSSTLYFTSGSELYTINTSTGAATAVGSTGVSGIGAMVTVNDILNGGVNPALTIDTLNTTTGAATFVANESGATGTFWGLAPVEAPEPASLALLLPVMLGAVARRNRGRRPVC